MFKLFTITAGVLLALAVGSYAKKVCTDACGESDDQSACLEKLWGRDASEDSIESVTDVSLGGYTEDYGDPWGFATPWDNLDYNEDALSMHGPAGARCTVDECRETFVNHQEQCLVMTDYSGVTCTTCATLPEPASALCLRFVYRAGGRCTADECTLPGLADLPNPSPRCQDNWKGDVVAHTYEDCSKKQCLEMVSILQDQDECGVDSGARRLPVEEGGSGDVANDGLWSAASRWTEEKSSPWFLEPSTSRSKRASKSRKDKKCSKKKSSQFCDACTVCNNKELKTTNQVQDHNQKHICLTEIRQAGGICTLEEAITMNEDAIMEDTWIGMGGHALNYVDYTGCLTCADCPASYFDGGQCLYRLRQAGITCTFEECRDAIPATAVGGQCFAMTDFYDVTCMDCSTLTDDKSSGAVIISQEGRFDFKLSDAQPQCLYYVAKFGNKGCTEYECSKMSPDAQDQCRAMLVDEGKSKKGKGKNTKSSKSSETFKSKKGKKGEASRLIMTQSATSKARAETGAGVAAVVAMMGLVALVAAKTLRGDAATSATEATNLLSNEHAVATELEANVLGLGLVYV